MIRYLVPVALIALSACGSRGDLKPATGAAMPVKPFAATATPTATRLMTPSVQVRPLRSDDLSRSSEQRKRDDFDLPPN